MRHNAFGGRAPPGPGRWGSLGAPPDLLAAIEGCLLLRGREGKGRGKERKGMGRGKGGRGGEGEKGKDDLHPTLFLGPGQLSLA